MGFTRDMDSAACLVDIDMGTVGDVERRIERHVHSVVRSLLVHFALGRAVTPNKFVFAIYGYVGVFDSEVEVNIASVLFFAGHAGVIFFFVI